MERKSVLFFPYFVFWWVGGQIESEPPVFCPSIRDKWEGDKSLATISFPVPCADHHLLKLIIFLGQTCHLGLNGHRSVTQIAAGWQNTCPREYTHTCGDIFIFVEMYIHFFLLPKNFHPPGFSKVFIVVDVLSRNNGHADKKLWNTDDVWSAGEWGGANRPITFRAQERRDWYMNLG